ncbi:YMGG-like glycine zipper-containing protein [Sphingomonas sp.]|uniref:YMGG-like glycine zipper-containing protein n=1 Tax=Sphingomonas sp. TaxID=28214 RepID=UPI003CC64CF7
MSKIRTATIAALLLSGPALAACNTNTGKGAAVGALGGAAVGAIAGDAGKGAIIGAAGGATVGAIKDSQRHRNCYYDNYGRKVCR